MQAPVANTVVKRTGDGAIVEFRSVVDAVNCAVELQRAMVERNAEVAPDKRIEFRVGIQTDWRMVVDRLQAAMAISSNPLSSTRKSARAGTVSLILKSHDVVGR
jgi:hypothetical protein